MSLPPIPGLEVYRLERELGRGATAEVYVGVHQSDGKRVALKVLRPDPSATASELSDLKRRIKREFETVGRIKHQNIVAIYEVFPDLTPPALVMEWVDGETLQDFQKRLPYVLPELGVLICIEILKAIEAAHQHGIIHRDLKPSNVMVSKKGEVKVTDFGLAKFTLASLGTVTGSIMGSPEYMSPEQARGDALTEQSDLFSLTSILYFLVTGTSPFSKPTPIASIASVVEARFESAQKRNPKISNELEAVLTRGFSKNPSGRFGSATLFRQELEKLLKETGFPIPTLSQWLENPSQQTVAALSQMADSLAQRTLKEIKRGSPEQAHLALRRLSQVAPSSQMLMDLSDQLSQLEQKKIKFAKLWPLLLGGGLLLGGAGVWFTLDSEPKKPIEDPVVLAKETPLAPSPTPIPEPSPIAVIAKEPLAEPAQLEVPKPKPTPKPTPKPPTQLVKFDLPPGVGASLDGVDIKGAKSLRVKPGPHRLELRMKGYKPITQTIVVKESEPTVIKVGGGD